MMTRWCLVACTLACAAALHAGELTYTFYDLGVLSEGGISTYAEDINDAGVVTGGSYYDVLSSNLAYRWVNGVMTVIPVWRTSACLGGKGISDNGSIACNGTPGPVTVWHEGDVVDMDVPDGCEENEKPSHINDNATFAVGSCCPDDGTHYDRPTVYWAAHGRAVLIDFLPDAPPEAQGWAEGVNNDGVVVGRMGFGADSVKAFIWEDGVLTEIPNAFGGDFTNAYAINNHGLVVGNASGAMSYDMHTGVMLNLGPGTALAVNDRGVAVGLDVIDLSALHGMVYIEGMTIDLHEFFPDEWESSYARGINNYGWIVGCGDKIEGVTRAWLLIPRYEKGDFDGDGDVDLQDSAHFQRCFAAQPYTDGTLHVGCSVFDFDDDVDLDLADYAAFQSAFTGPTAPNLNPNGPG